MSKKYERRFWVVWNTNHHASSARYKHYSRVEAQHEAERLARQHPGQCFVVLKAVGGAKGTALLDTVDFQTRHIEPLDIPF
jgi:hypothetical protein